MTPQETAQCLRRLHAAYGTEVTADMGDLWSNVFASDDPDLARDAVDEWIRERRHFPTPAELREVMRQLLRRAEGLPPLPVASSIRITGPDGGFKIAYAAYCEEVRRDGREPKPYDEFVGLVPVPKVSWR